MLLDVIRCYRLGIKHGLLHNLRYTMILSHRLSTNVITWMFIPLRNWEEA
jgi:hypothetical protein